jgi:5,10-methylenetetrahydromethanopterin reductase
VSDRPAYSCALPPSSRAPEYAAEAERLGYKRVWLFDSPALYGDIWVCLALTAQATSTIGLGTGVAIPSMRHPLVAASAIGTIEELAPGRLTAAFGTGYTGRIAMGRRPMGWAALATYVRQVRALLAGEVVEVEGAAAQMIHTAEFGPDRPIGVPIWVAPSGPKGYQVARELQVPGVLTPGLPTEDQRRFPECGLLAMGTVVRPGEDHSSPRLVEAVGPAYTTGIHGLYEYAPDLIPTVPGGAEWQAALEAERPEGQRHLGVHTGHLCAITDRDRGLVESAGAALLETGWTGDAAAVAARFDEAGSCGVTEVLYTPGGPDITGELEAFAAAAAS